MSSKIQNLLDLALQDGARSTKFECQINFKSPMLFGNNKEIVALVKTSQFPGKSHEIIDFKFKGRTAPIKGQVKYENTWACTFYLSQDHKLKKAFDEWIESLDQRHNIKNISQDVYVAQSTNDSEGYFTSFSIEQKDFHGDQTTAIYELFNVFPKSVSSVEIDYSAVGQILEFTVEFAYSFYNIKVEKTTNGTFADDLSAKGKAAISDGVQSIKDGLKNTISAF